ncbi:MAG: TIGR04255 family protein [Myxococcota bacterium]|nr:TIGR04255 family protein [Myxococcota bacterium]
MPAPVDPLVAPLPTEVPLKDAPLVRVIAQVRFPEILSVEQREFVAPFQEAIRATYPVLRQEQTQDFMVGPSQVASIKPQVVWRFADLKGEWRVSLAAQFLALETTRYTSRADLLGRLRVVLEALEAHLQPSLSDRLGLRYIDRISGDSVADIATLVRPEVRGINGTVAASHAALSMTESFFEVGVAQLRARWGQLPANFTLDPLALEAVAEKSWVLDLDMFSSAPMPFSVEGMLASVQGYAERIYTVFRWAVTDEFLRRYGGVV